MQDGIRSAHHIQASPLLLRFGEGPSVALSHPSNYLTQQPTREQIYERQNENNKSTQGISKAQLQGVCDHSLRQYQTMKALIK